MARKQQDEMERHLHRSLMVHRVVERALHDDEAIWQLRPVGGTPIHAMAKVSGRKVTISTAEVLFSEKILFEGVDVLINGEHVLTTPLPAGPHGILAGEVAALLVELELDTFALV